MTNLKTISGNATLSPVGEAPQQNEGMHHLSLLKDLLELPPSANTQTIQEAIQHYSEIDSRDNFTFSFEFAPENKNKIPQWLRLLSAVMQVHKPSISNTSRDWMSQLAQSGQSGYDVIAYFLSPPKPHHDYNLSRPLKITIDSIEMVGQLQVQRVAHNNNFRLKIFFPKNLVSARKLTADNWVRLLTGESVNLSAVRFELDAVQAKTFRRLTGLDQSPAAGPGNPAGKQKISYKMIYQIARGDLVEIHRLIGVLYGEAALNEIITQYRLGLKSSVRPKHPPTVHEMTVRTKISHESYRNLENPGAESPLPDKNVLIKMATLMGWDPEVIFYKSNLMTSPQIKPEFYVFKDKVVLIDHDFLKDFLGQLSQDTVAGLSGQHHETLKKIVKAHLQKYGAYRAKGIYDKYNGETLRNFLTLFLTREGSPLPEKETLGNIARLANIPIDDLYAYVIDSCYPALRSVFNELKTEHFYAELLKQQGKSEINIHLNQVADVSSVNRLGYYQQTSDTKIPNTKKLGFRLFAIRKIMGLNLVEMAIKMGIEDQNWSKLEMDEGQGCLTDLLINRISQKLSLPRPILTKWISDTYPLLDEQKSDDPRYSLQGSLKKDLTKALIEHNNYESVASALRNFLGLIDPEFATTSEDTVINLINFNEAQNRRKVPDDSHWAAFAGVFGDRLNTAQMWARTHPELTSLFPSLASEEPHLVLPDDVNLATIWQTSIPLAIIRTRLKQTTLLAGKNDLMEALGYSAPYYVTIAESSDVNIRDLDRIQAIGKATNIDPRLLYLSLHPWILLAVPVRNSKGEAHLGFGLLPDRKHHPVKGRRPIIEAIKKIFSLLSDGRVEIKKVLGEQKDPKAWLVQIGFNPNLAQRMLEYIRVLREDELVEIVRNINFPINAQKLLEGYRKGELLHFMGSLPFGEIDYSYPPGWTQESIAALDLLEIAKLISHHAGETFGTFWRREFNSNSFPNFQRKIDQGFSLEQMVHFCRLATQAGLGPDKISIKVIYLKFKQPFLSHFVTLKSGMPNADAAILLDSELILSEEERINPASEETTETPVIPNNVALAATNMATVMPSLSLMGR